MGELALALGIAADFEVNGPVSLSPKFAAQLAFVSGGEQRRVNHFLLWQTHAIQPGSLALALAIVQARARNSHRLSEASGSSCRKSCAPLTPGQSSSLRYVIWKLVPGSVITR